MKKRKVSQISIIQKNVDDPVDTLQNLESRYITILPDYMAKQRYIDIGMRTILLNWIVQIHTTLKCQFQETLYLAINILDRYLSHPDCNEVPTYRFQLIGCIALMIACKFEEIYNVLNATITRELCASVYTNTDIVRMEMDMLMTLKFDINVPTILNFVRFFSIDLDIDNDPIIMYIAELVIQTYTMLKYTPSVLVSSILALCYPLKQVPYQNSQCMDDILAIVTTLELGLLYTETRQKYISLGKQLSMVGKCSTIRSNT